MVTYRGLKLWEVGEECLDEGGESGKGGWLFVGSQRTQVLQEQLEERREERQQGAYRNRSRTL